MCFSSGNRAQREAQQAERERQAQIEATTGRVNSIFSNPQRAADIASVVAAVRSNLSDTLNRQKADTDRKNRFALARTGQIGGSLQVDRSRRLGEEYGRGLLDVERRAQGAGAEIESADQSSRMNLIGLAQSGLNSTAAAEQAAAMMRSNLNAAQPAALSQGLGNTFGTFADYFQRSRELGEQRRADRNFGYLYQSILSPPGGR